MAYPQPGFSGQPRQPGSPKRILLGTVAVVTMILVGFNGLIIWIYQKAGLSIAVTLGLFLATLGLNALRKRGSFVSLIAGYLQFLMIISIAVAVYVATRAGVAIGMQVGGIVFGFLFVISSLVLWYFWQNPPRVKQRIKFVAASLATLIVTIGSCGYIYWDYSRKYSNEVPLPADPATAVRSLIENGVRDRITFEDFTCPNERERIREVLEAFVLQNQELQVVSESMRVTELEDGTVEVTAMVYAENDSTGEEEWGPRRWTFRLVDLPERRDWCVFEIVFDEE